ncbi:MAG TPA: MBL fold metallo-hydrolase [Opitutus sp.]|nr:MBL fold metallo-hydrolase [Opitutus sp.]
MTLRLVALALVATASALAAEPAGVRRLAPGVWFHEGDHARVHCNNTWIELDGYVIVVDANYPAGAAIVIPQLRATTSKPVRYVIDTHFHPDHAFGNQLWADAGAEIVAQEATLAELQRSGPARWADEAKARPDVAASALALPTLTYRDALAFDDGHRRVELHFFGPGHTHGDTLVWLPHEKILATGDLCANGAFNYLHDSSLPGWIAVLEKAKALGAAIVCPGHGPVGGPEIVADQQRYLASLLREVSALVDAKKSPAEIKAAVPALGARLRTIESIARYVPDDFWLAAQVSDVAGQLGAPPLPP